MMSEKTLTGQKKDKRTTTMTMINHDISVDEYDELEGSSNLRSGKQGLNKLKEIDRQRQKSKLRNNNEYSKVQLNDTTINDTTRRRRKQDHTLIVDDEDDDYQQQQQQQDSFRIVKTEKSQDSLQVFTQ